MTAHAKFACLFNWQLKSNIEIKMKSKDVYKNIFKEITIDNTILLILALNVNNTIKIYRLLCNI